MKVPWRTSPELDTGAAFTIFEPTHGLRKRSRRLADVAAEVPPVRALRLVRGDESAPRTNKNRPALPDTVEERLIRVLIAAPEPGETIDAAFRRKEQDVGDLFATLEGAQSQALYSRLDNPRDGDQLAAHFLRLVPARRQRLLEVLSGCRRRDAFAVGAR